MLKLKLDHTDYRILEILREDARSSSEKIAEKLKKFKIKVSRQTVHNRIKVLEDNEIITKYTCLVNEKKLGKEVTAIILVMLDKAASLWEFTAKELWSKQKELEICEMHHIAGDYDALIKTKTKNIDSLEEKLAIITSTKGVRRTHTMVCLSSYEHGPQSYEE